jgi:exopolyphosphatase/guanosine-5'-triphosphate,3'-diphosphate pyrophosphatase
MNKKKTPKAAAVIDIGSSVLKMRISQLKKGEIADLDRLTYPISLGHEVFTDGSISFQSVREMSKALSGFKALMQEYGITEYRAVATTAIREAQNRAFVLDQIHIQNGFTVEVLEDAEEKTLIYSEILDVLQKTGDLDPGYTLLSYIGSGTIGIAMHDGENMVYSQNASIGALKLHDMLGSIEEQTENFDMVLEEYLQAALNFRPFENGNDINNIVLTGNEVEMIASLCAVEPKNGLFKIPVKRLMRLYRGISKMTSGKIALHYHLPEREAELLYSALAIYVRLIGLTKAQYILSPKVDLWDALMRQMLLPRQNALYFEHVSSNALSCAENIADHYQCDHMHAQAVRTIAKEIFDRTKPLHGMDRKQRLILDLAATLHDCGHFVSIKEHLDATFDLIRHMGVYGMTDKDMRRIAYVARYNEYQVPDVRDFVDMSERSRTEIAKLVAIFRLANALDKSQKQKIPTVKVKLSDEQLTITAQTNENVLLEEWAFAQCAAFFADVFGVKPVLKIKQTLI